MNQKTFQLAKEYSEQIKRLRQEIDTMDKVTYVSFRSQQNMSMVCVPEITRDLNEFPRLKAAIVATLKKNLMNTKKN